MKVEKFKVLLYLKKSGLDKSGKAPIMGRITVNRTMAQFSCKLSCTPELWNPRESRLNGKSKEAVEVNAKIDKLLLAVNSAFDSLSLRKNRMQMKENPCKLTNYGDFLFLVHSKNKHIKAFFRCTIRCTLLPSMSGTPIW